MKKLPLLAVLVAVVILATVQPSQAINKEWAAVLGFAGGLLVANTCVVGPPPPVVVGPPPPPPVVYAPPPPVILAPPAPGRYVDRPRQQWMPGRWIETVGPRGGIRRVWQPGHYQTVVDRIWISG